MGELSFRVTAGLVGALDLGEQCRLAASLATMPRAPSDLFRTPALRRPMSPLAERTTVAVLKARVLLELGGIEHGRDEQLAFLEVVLGSNRDPERHYFIRSRR
jgi:hypothetical protein